MTPVIKLMIEKLMAKLVKALNPLTYGRNTMSDI